MNKGLNIKITGASGYLGNLISKALEKKGHQPSGISRNLLYGNINELQKEIAGSDIIINLAGAPILQRWTKKNKKVIFESRSKTTSNLVQAIQLMPQESRPKEFISASAIGIYKAGEHHNENSKNFDEGFVGDVVRNWEEPLNNLPEEVIKIVFRIGLVLGKEAKTIKNLLLPFKLGLGATIGNGKQPFPFIHENDVAEAFVWAVEEYQNNAVFNLTVPENITNKEFTKAMAKNLHRQAIFVIPKFLFSIVLGKATNLITESPSVSSEKLVKAGFKFKYPDIDSALRQITEK